MWYWLVKWLGFVIFKLFFRFKVEGIENLPQKTNFIIVANHVSFFDPFLMMAAVPKKIRCIALRSLYRISFIRWVLKLLETLPSGTSSKAAIDLLMKNKVVGLFPEGGRSYDGKLREFRRGVALLAFKTGRPIVPCAIIGAYEAFPRTALLPRLHPIKVKIGKPRYLLKEFGEVIDDMRLQEGIFNVRNAVKEMMHAG